MQIPTPSPLSSASSQPLSSWVFGRLAHRPGHSRGRSLALIGGMIAVIGWLDYLSGVRVSLDLFYLGPIAFSVAWLGRRAGYLTAFLCIAVRVSGDLAAGTYAYPRTAFWNRLVDLSVYFFVVWLLHALLSLWRQLDERVRQRTAALEQAIVARNQLQTQLFEISRRERGAIGHDLHDGLGQQLTATSMAADLLAQRLHAGGNPAADDARTIVKMIQEGIAKTRQIARGLLLAAIEPEALISELEELALAIGRENKVEARFSSHGNFRLLDAATTSHVFYIAQEAARNALRHARPTCLEISLQAEGSAVVLTISDNGAGLPSPEARRAGVGLRIMAHRAELIGGELTIESAPGRGTQVRCRVPRPEAAAASATP